MIEGVACKDWQAIFFLLSYVMIRRCSPNMKASGVVSCMLDGAQGDLGMGGVGFRVSSL